MLSDTENRFKKKFNMLNYFERERRELLDPIISEEVTRGQEEKRIENIEVSKQSFEEDQMLKAKIQEIGPEVVTMPSITERKNHGSLQQSLRAISEGIERVQKHLEGSLPKQHHQSGQSPQVGGKEEEGGGRKAEKRFRDKKSI